MQNRDLKNQISILIYIVWLKELFSQYIATYGAIF